ncbi:MAG: hypothetical protein IJG15_02930, partial [Lachnospiraceae bacterium]|nr:hypothetical protein [Lachnospiraceae bacterium]
MEKDTIQKEQEFMRLLQEALKQARQNGGRISRGEISDLFGAFDLQEAQVGQIEAYIEKLPERVMSVNRRLNALAKEKKELEKQLNEMLEQERKPLVT